MLRGLLGSSAAPKCANLSAAIVWPRVFAIGCALYKASLTKLNPKSRRKAAVSPMSAEKNGGGFQRTAVRTESRLVIKSVCGKCGVWKLLSHQDGSLEEWEVQHECKDGAAPRKSAADKAKGRSQS